MEAPVQKYFCVLESSEKEIQYCWYWYPHNLKTIQYYFRNWCPTSSIHLVILRIHFLKSTSLLYSGFSLVPAIINGTTESNLCKEPCAPPPA